MAATPSSLHDLISANHILHHHGCVDAYGHISLRNPSNSNTFFLSQSKAPALVSQAADIVEYKVENATPMKSGVAEGYKERFIHSEIYKRFPSVNSVVHSHSEAVIAYGISGVQMKAVFHMAGFLGTHVPVFDISNHYSRNDTHNLLVSNSHLGAALASSFTKSESFVYRAGATGASLVSSLISKTGQATLSELQPDHTVVMMRGHGFTAIGSSVKEAVFRTIYTHHNASIQTTALLLRKTLLTSQDRAKPREEREKPSLDDGLHYLSESEVVGCKEMGEMTVDRPWELWVREVEAMGLYVNDA